MLMEKTWTFTKFQNIVSRFLNVKLSFLICCELKKVYENLSEFENEKMILQNPDNLEKKELHIYDDVVDEEIHSLELSNWLNLNKNY